jgi:hypothetical protein
MQYKDFIKANFHKLPADMTAPEKMKALGKMWSSEKTKTVPVTKKAKGGELNENAENGAGLFGNIGSGIDAVGSLFGFGLDGKKRRAGRPRKEKKHVTGGELNANPENGEGAGLFGDIGSGIDSIGSLFGFGLDGKKHKRSTGGSVVAGSVKKSVGRPRKNSVATPRAQESELNNNELFQLINKKYKEKGAGFDLGSVIKHITPILPFFM